MRYQQFKKGEILLKKEVFQTVNFDVREHFEISVFEILRVSRSLYRSFAALKLTFSKRIVSVSVFLFSVVFQSL